MLNVENIRKDFPILAREIHGKPLVYMDNAATTQKPIQVIDSLVDYYSNYNSNVHRGVHLLSMEATEQFELAREKIANFINSKNPESIIWTRNSSESLNLVAYMWGRANIKSGDEILVTAMEHHSNLIPWQELAKEKGAFLKIIPIDKNGCLDLLAYRELITPKTKLVSVVHVSNAIGTINPVKEMIQIAHQVGAKFLLDGAQSAPHMPIDVQELDCDFLVFSGHKMMGPTGIGVLFVKKDILDHLDPLYTGGEMVLEVTYETATWAPIPMKFEAGTPNIADAIALGAAVDYLSQIGMDEIHEYEKLITAYTLDKFSVLEEKGIILFGPHDPLLRGAIFSFYTPDVHPHDLGTIMDHMGIALRTGHHCAMPLVKSLGVPATARASLYVYNTFSEVDTFIDGTIEALRYFKNGS
jgi:cysteine desulfurase/selenocysteine lyase